MTSRSKDSGLSINKWLRGADSFTFSVFTGLSAFLLYSCVYAFRKTFAVATFEGIQYFAIDYKVWLITFQVAGYAVSKFAGIKIISELNARSRATGILSCIAVATLSWLLFAVIPAPFNILCLFLNGFPLGLVWGMVFGYIEGRRNTDVLGAALAVSFIFSAGLFKTIGAYIIRDWHVSETWMPLTAALVFLGPLLLFLWLLDQVPAPNTRDEQLRTRRQPMNAEDRKNFIVRFFGGLLPVLIFYSMLTAFRDFRDNFSAEIWISLGFENTPEIFTTTEIPVTIVCLILIGSLVAIRNNGLALQAILWIILLGTSVLGIATYAFEEQRITAPQWMTLIGIGLYLGYIPFNSAFFDRLLATFKVSGTVGFVMYLADSIGYLGSVGVLFYKQFGQPDLSWLEFFMKGAYFLSVTGTMLVIWAMVFFALKSRNRSIHSKFTPVQEADLLKSSM